jgi:hypothetical protein
MLENFPESFASHKASDRNYWGLLVLALASII